MNDQKYGINGSTVFIIETGEVIDRQELKRVIEKDAIEEFDSKLNGLKDFDLTSQYVIVKYRNREYQCVDIKRDYEFNKEFRVELREIMLSKELSKNSRCFIGTLSPFVSFPSNAIHINYKNPTYEELMEIVDMSKPTLLSTLKELEDKEIIKRVKQNGQLIIYFNCFLYCGGYCVEKDTFELFKKSIYNPLLYK
jgi:DNA-binding transcriptional ArsR family regulator